MLAAAAVAGVVLGVCTARPDAGGPEVPPVAAVPDHATGRGIPRSQGKPATARAAGGAAGTGAEDSAVGASEAAGDRPVAAERAAGAAGEEPAQHTVQPGETLYAIARRYDVPLPDLMAANGLTEAAIFPGQALVIPGESPELHVVRSGDTAWEIAELYGVSLEQLAAANPALRDLGLLQVGQEVRLPTGASWHPAAAAASVIKGDGLFAWPVIGRISSPFGLRWGRNHSGIDIAADQGAPIRAARNGVVTTAGWVPGYGLTVILQHKDDSQTLYAHSARLLVKLGDKVTQGQIIARVGSTGRSTGPHLHFEIIAGRPVDPLRHLPRLDTADRK